MPDEGGGGTDRGRREDARLQGQVGEGGSRALDSGTPTSVNDPSAKERWVLSDSRT
ncbi:hypothetical protein NFX46_15955 [Streptomyces phaeoluteigriseus]|uniref:Uncharacterized protein n=1 Tax=Streptomyces phaeoluteigriseus TaxID=114686 RepID=A0ABY4Z836_9ACTN|nr:hypothetical protein [Streptomyces phaeoluteigriseus]USQ85151.1 hypothetical protein NFX46_15955 [Streptomyces phaeoluteigriseus]